MEKEHKQTSITEIRREIDHHSPDASHSLYQVYPMLYLLLDEVIISSETWASHTDTLILDLYPPELWQKNLRCYKSPSLGYFVTVAWKTDARAKK